MGDFKRPYLVATTIAIVIIRFICIYYHKITIVSKKKICYPLLVGISSTIPLLSQSSPTNISWRIHAAKHSSLTHIVIWKLRQQYDLFFNNPPLMTTCTSIVLKIKKKIRERSSLLKKGTVLFLPKWKYNRFFVTKLSTTFFFLQPSVSNKLYLEKITGRVFPQLPNGSPSQE